MPVHGKMFPRTGFLFGFRGNTGWLYIIIFFALSFLS